MSRPALISVAALAAVLLAGCEKTIDSDKAEKTIGRLVATKIGTQVERVDCPSGKTAKQGDTFPCRVTGKDGSSADAIVTETDDEGGVRVTARFLPTDTTERSLAAQLTNRSGKPVGVDCQDIIVARKNVTFECVTSSEGRKGRVRARQIDDAGSVTYRALKSAS
ncbi:MAG: DUF4333 domain-containing protein [Solirubrobacteraceae bacterium]